MLLRDWDPHQTTHVDELHIQGVLGDSVIVVIVDTGIDYYHPYLGGGFGPGFKVEGGYDLAGDTYVPGDTPVPDDNRIDCVGHGTHVAVIVGSSYPNLHGVAPNTTLWIYKVFGCMGRTTEDVVAQGFLRAFDEGATALLGLTQGCPENIFATVASRITTEGTFVLTAAGNDGANGPFYQSSGENGYGTLGVGSVESTQDVAWTVLATSSSGESRETPYTAKIDSCNIYLEESSDPDLSAKKILLPLRGNCSWQLEDVFGSSAKWVFFYNNKNDSWEYPDRVFYDPVNQGSGLCLISYEDGIWLLDQDVAGDIVTYTFKTTPGDASGVAMYSTSGGILDDFSSWGPALDGRINPEISALSGGWDILSGTSRATPYIAGTAALVSETLGGRKGIQGNTAEVVRSRIITSGKPVNRSYDPGPQASGGQQGAGLVDAFKAGATIHTRPQGEAWIGVQPPYDTDEGNIATVELTVAKITVVPHTSEGVAITFNKPAVLRPGYLPVYGGFINAIGSNGEAFRVSYFAIKGSLYNKIWELQRGVPLYLGTNGLIAKGNVYNFQDGNVPHVVFNLLFATREWSFDLVNPSWTAADWVYPPVADENNYYGPLTSLDQLSNTMTPLPIKLYTRDQSGLTLVPTQNLGNGSLIPNREYKILGRTPRTFGDYNNINDWQTGVSASFFIQSDA